MCRKKAAGHKSAKRSFLLCISLPCGNEGIAGFLGIGKSWNSANRGVRNNHTKPTIKPVCRLGKLAEFLDKKYDTSSPKRKAPRSNRGGCAKKEEVLSPSGESALLFLRKARQAALCGIISVRLCISHCKVLPAAHSESQQSIPPISD